MQKLYAGEKPCEKPKPTTLTRDEGEAQDVAQHLRQELAYLERRRVDVERLLDDTRKNCTHRAFFDTAGFEYDFRSCGICGASLGLV
jgi:hypothetical protein